MANLRIDTLGVIKPLEAIVIFVVWLLFNITRCTEVYLAVDALPAHSSNGFGEATGIAASEIAVPFSGGIINNLYLKEFKRI